MVVSAISGSSRPLWSWDLGFRLFTQGLVFSLLAYFRFLSWWLSHTWGMLALGKGVSEWKLERAVMGVVELRCAGHGSAR